MKKTISVEVDISPVDYATNYGEGYPDEEAADYTIALVEEAVRRRFDEVGGWATVLTVA